MMAQAWYDPLARAALAVANHDLARVFGLPAGDWCSRCHAPVAWLEDRSLPADGSAIGGAGADGVSCSVCHRMLDGVAETAGCDPAAAHGPFDCGGPGYSGQVTSYENAQYVLDRGLDRDGDGAPDEAVLHGPRAESQALHAWAGGPDDFVTRSDHCGTCHNVTNPVVRVPTLEELAGATPSHLAVSHAEIAGRPMPVERTHAEWAASDFRDGERCQDCHMKPVPGRAASTGPLRSDLATHETAGGNAWVPSLIPLFFPGQATPAMLAALERASEAARRTLATAADVTVERFVGETLVLRVTNRTGHRLPTGYPEGRRMWLHVEGFDAAGARVFESGAYDPDEARLATADTLGNPLRVWEIHLGIYDRETRSAKHTFHFALNDVIVKDNRIPPRGLRIEAAASEGVLLVREPHECLSLPADLRGGCETYEWTGAGRDGERAADPWDLVGYELPPGVVSVRATLYYQTASREYVEFLADPLRSGEYADRFVAGLLPAWAATGKSPPVVMTTAAAAR